MWLFTLIAFAIITATTASAITVVIIIFSFLCFFVEPSCFGLLFHILSCNNLSYLKPSVLIAQNLLFLLFECKGNEYQQQWHDKMMKNGLFLTHVKKWQLGA